jgi:hypothetical protein
MTCAQGGGILRLRRVCEQQHEDEGAHMPCQGAKFVPRIARSELALIPSSGPRPTSERLSGPLSETFGSGLGGRGGLSQAQHLCHQRRPTGSPVGRLRFQGPRSGQ